MNLEQPTLTIVGVIETFIPTTWSTLELQGRWSARLLSGGMSVPSKQKMLKDINRKPRVTKHYQVVRKCILCYIL